MYLITLGFFCLFLGIKFLDLSIKLLHFVVSSLLLCIGSSLGTSMAWIKRELTFCDWCNANSAYRLSTLMA